MKNAALHEFVETVMAIQPGMPGLGTTSSGITGTIGSQGLVGEQLKTSVLTFAAECAKPEPDRPELYKMAQQVEGDLLSTGIISGISESKLEKLIEDLHELVKSD